MRRELVCTEPATPPRLEVRTREVPRPKSGQVLVRVQATAVNPIDVKRAVRLRPAPARFERRSDFSTRARQ